MPADCLWHHFIMQPIKIFFPQVVSFHFHDIPKRASCKMAYGWCNSWQIPCSAAVSKFDWRFENFAVAPESRQRYSPIGRTKRQLCKATEAATGGGSNSLLCKRKEVAALGYSCWGESGCLFVVVVWLVELEQQKSFSSRGKTTSARVCGPCSLNNSHMALKLLILSNSIAAS